MPVRMQIASLDVVRNAMAIRMFISRCTLINFCLLCSYFIASIQTGAPYSRRGKMAPLYMAFKVSCLIPHVSLTGLDKLYISFVHLCATYVMYSLNLHL